MRSLFVVLVFMAIFAGCAYIEHKEIQARLDAESEYAANLRELEADYAGVTVYYSHHTIDELSDDEIDELNAIIATKF